jgi:hypothetical protein
MNNFLDRFKPQANALHNALRGGRSFQGTGQSLGGGNAHHVVVPIRLDEAGSLGMGVEKMKGSGGCIVSFVEPASQSHRAGIQRGDVVCFAGTDGKEEVQYGDFLKLAKLKDRPLCFDVRRVRTTASSASTSAASASSGGGGAGGGKTPAANSKQSAEAFARKQAMIAAAEARDRAHKAKLRPISRANSAAGGGGASTKGASSSLPDNDPKSEASRAAVEEAKKKEAMTTAELGYNPYETNRATAGQARQATVAVTHGAIQAAGRSNDAGSSFPPVQAPTAVRPPANALLPHPETEDAATQRSSVPSPEFDHALEVLVTSSLDGGASSISTLHKLVLNATTKGQQSSDKDAGKFRRVRLANPKIAACVVDPPGAIDVLLACGFVLMEDESTQESVLVYPLVGEDESLPPWLPAALERMQNLGGK